MTEVRCPLIHCEYNFRQQCRKRVITLMSNFKGKEIRCDDYKQKGWKVKRKEKISDAMSHCPECNAKNFNDMEADLCLTCWSCGCCYGQEDLDKKG